MQCYANESCLTPTTGAAPEIFASAIKYFIAAQCLIQENWPPDYDGHNGEIFDYIIVGAGSAGSVVANRLSEDKHRSVLLIEAGGDPPIESIIPNMVEALFHTPYDWDYKTTFNGKTNAANKNGSVYWPRGKMLGGSSGINAMIYMKGNTNDYKVWYDEGNKEWNLTVIEKYFKKAESLQNEALLQNPVISDSYGHNGPLAINRFNSTNKYLDLKILESWNEIGIKTVRDLNTANAMGGGIYVATAYNGIRNNVANAYLIPIRDRKNLKVMKKSFVTKVLMNKNTKQAFGVTIERKGKIIKVFARLEVILSAGSINTPQLLLLSGIGPMGHLISKNIENIIDLPMVGQNLQDHCIIPIIYCGNYPDEANKVDGYFDDIKYLYNRTGILAGSPFANLVALYSIDNNTSRTKYQTHLTYFSKKSPILRNVYSQTFYYKDVVVNDIIKKNQKYALYSFMFNLLHPQSRGNISLSSNNPHDHPIIYANYFEDEADLTSAIKGIKEMLKVGNSTFFKSIDAFLYRLKWPACNKFSLVSDEYWRCVCINMVITVYHPVGTTRMGTNRNNSVVDSRLRVHGVKGLRVIDAGVMPNITSGNTNGPIIMIAERAADLVKEDNTDL